MEHLKARTGQPNGYPERYSVPDGMVGWEVPYPDYRPTYYVASSVLANDVTKNPKGWADPEDHRVAGHASRPLNPNGRTGVCGRGLLGKWGPNYAADPIITRVNRSTNKFEVLVVIRKDNREMALPGGMVDNGETAIAASQREAVEEALGGKDRAFSMAGAKLVYKGYVDDPRNTDNAWMETSAFHKHLDTDEDNALVLEAGDDAAKVFWMEISVGNMERLYASHAELVRSAIEKMVAGSDETMAIIRYLVREDIAERL